MNLKNILGNLVGLHTLKSVQTLKKTIDSRPDFIHGYARETLAQIIRIIAVTRELWFDVAFFVTANIRLAPASQI